MRKEKAPEGMLIDKNGREIRVGDVLKVFHFVGSRSKKHYMYKQVVERLDPPKACTPMFVISHLERNPPDRGTFVMSVNNKVWLDAEIVQGYEGGVSFDQRQRYDTAIIHDLDSKEGCRRLAESMVPPMISWLAEQLN